MLCARHCGLSLPLWSLWSSQRDDIKKNKHINKYISPNWNKGKVQGVIRIYTGGLNLDQEFSESIPESVTYKLNFKIMTEGGQARSKLVLQAKAGWGPSEKLIRDGKKAGTREKEKRAWGQERVHRPLWATHEFGISNSTKFLTPLNAVQSLKYILSRSFGFWAENE